MHLCKTRRAVARTSFRNAGTNRPSIRSPPRHWFFGSNGAANETTGEWDAATKTLTWKGDLGGGLSITAAYRFTGKNAFESKVLVTGAGGKTYFHLEGKAVRQ